jgi:predicted metal-dependent hydrolase
MKVYDRSRLLDAVKKFNEQDYFECHEILEDIWFDVRDDSRDIYRGLLHIAVGLYHLTKKNNPKGTLIQLNKAAEKLARFENTCREIDMPALLKQVNSLIKKIQKKEQPGRLPKIKLLV